MIKAIRIFGIVWISAIFALIIFGNIAFLYFAESKLDALARIRDDLNPFNISAFLVKVVLASPGIVALVLADRLKARAKRTTPV
jgi:hypothetical protein